MPDETRTIRSVEWRSVFPVVHLFRAGRMALQPGKMLFALAFLLLTYGLGRVMDLLWLSKYSYNAEQVGLRQLPTQYFSSSYGTSISGPFDVFLKWELTQLNHIINSVLNVSPAELIYYLTGFIFTGPSWLCRFNPCYAVIFGLFVLIAWSLFGGAISRIAAVHVARDEKMSMGSALRFSSGKLLSFFFAPLLLALFIGGLGLAIACINLLYYIQWGIGGILVGLAFILTLCLGFVMTVAVFGAVGGSALMYPTIAVEGSDSFDAISRSFSYFFYRPWKVLYYSLVSLVYGVATYLLLRWFIFAMFLLIRQFQIWFLGAKTLERFDLFFPPQNDQYLTATMHLDSVVGTGEKVGAGLVGFWYFLVISLLGAYAISYYFSSTTITYFLLRKCVDATEMDDVYLEEGEEEELADIAAASTDPAPPAPPTPPTPPAPAGATPNPSTPEPPTTSALSPDDASEEPPSDDQKGTEQPPTFSSSPLP